ncbi:MAG: hypothetical protein IPJ77_20910 [Planctomycetes bacterium]|nr:hypothetical protein [Planctomycetota bacterium]
MRWSVLGVVLGGLVGGARAERFDPARIAAGARWVAHVDVEALARSEVYAALVADGVVKLEDEVEALEAFGLDPVKDLRSVTVYSVDPMSEHTIVLLRGNENVDRALAKKQTEEGYREEVFEGKALHAWGDAWFAAVLRQEGSADRLVVQSDDRASVALACAVLEGRGKSFAQSESPVLKNLPGEGSIVFAAATTKVSELSGLEVASSVVKLADDLVFDLGESHGELYAKLRVDAETAKEARQIQQVLQGAAALVALMGGEDPDVGRVLQDVTSALRFTTEETRVQAEFRMSTRLLLEHLRTLNARDGDAGSAPSPARRTPAGGRLERLPTSNGTRK